MTTVNEPTPNDTEEPEDSRTRWLLAFLGLPIIVAPAAVVVFALATGADPFPWPAVLTAFTAAVTVASLASIGVLAWPKVAHWFGATSLVDTFGDERGWAIFAGSALPALVVTWSALFVVAVATANTAAGVALGVGAATFYLSMLILSRRS